MISTTIEYAHDIHSDIWKLLISNYLQFDCKSIKLHAKLPANVQTNNYIQKQYTMNSFILVTNDQMKTLKTVLLTFMITQQT